MNTFVKLYGSLLKSTVWQEPLPTKVVWITLLVLADRHGNVDCTVPGLASLAGVTLAECESALAKFLGPDRYSRTQDNEGRRIAVITHGWNILNHAQYLEIQTDRQAADAQRKRRARHLRTPADTADMSAPSALDRDLDPDPSDPSDSDSERDPDPRVARDALSAGIFDAPSFRNPPAMSWDLPADWRPKPHHEQRVRELKMDMRALYSGFKTQDWNRPYKDWDRRFERWIEDARIRRETAQAKR